MEEKLKKVVDQQVKRFPECWTGVAGFVIVGKDTAAVEDDHSNYGACHASLNYTRKPVICVNGHKADWYNTNPDFMKWVAFEAPFNHGVLNKGDEKTLFNHASVIDTELVGKGGALWQCKAMRHFIEDTWKIDTWTTLRNHGLDGLQAFIGADILDSTGSPGQRTHVGLFGYTTPDKLRKIYDDLRAKERIDTSNAAAMGQAGIGCWGSMKGKKVKKSDGWGGFVEVFTQGDAKDYVAALKEIFTGDPKNVK